MPDVPQGFTFGNETLGSSLLLKIEYFDCNMCFIWTKFSLQTQIMKHLKLLNYHLVFGFPLQSKFPLTKIEQHKFTFQKGRFLNLNLLNYLTTYESFHHSLPNYEAFKTSPRVLIFIVRNPKQKNICKIGPNTTIQPT